MYRLIIAAVLAFLLPVFAYADTDTNNNYPDIDKTVTLDVKGESLSDVLEMLHRKTGVQLRVSKDIADQKVTIFVDDKPLNGVMAGLSKLFGFRWTHKEYKGQDIYELWEPETIRRQRLGNYEQVISQAWENLDKIASQKAANTKTYTIYDKQVAVLSSLYCNMPVDVKQALRSGFSVRYCSDTNETKWQLPGNITEQLLKISAESSEGSASKEDSSESQKIIVCFRPIVTENLAILYQINHSEVNNCLFDIPIIETQVDSRKPEYPQPENEILSKEIKITHTDIKEAVTPKGLDLSDPANKCYREGANYVNRSDILELIHRKAGIEIFSDYYSTFSSADSLIITGIIRAVLQCCSYHPNQQIKYWSEGDVLYTRVLDIYEADSGEAPNKIVQQWQDAYKKNGRLGLDEKVQICLLNDRQRNRLNHPAYKLKLGIKDSIFIPSTKALSAGRFYGLLSPQQRSQALSSALPVDGLSFEQCVELSGVLEQVSSFNLYQVGIYDKNERRVDKLNSGGERIPVSISIKKVFPPEYKIVGFVFTVWFDDGSSYEIPVTLDK
ncbi:MAG: hypothetical protein ACYC27_23010 [Armatimonadota bacterium]